jgi:hypothetical protein
MFVYAGMFGEKSAVWISVAAIAVAMADYLFLWYTAYLPSLFSSAILTDMQLAWHGIVSGMAVTAALAVTKWRMASTEFPLAGKRLKRRTYGLLIRTSLLASTFLTLSWIGFVSVCHATGTTMFAPAGLFIAGCLYFIAIILYYKGEQSTFKKPMLYGAFAFALLYPLLVHWSMALYRENLAQLLGVNWAAIAVHYLSLGLLTILGTMAVGRIFRMHRKNVHVQHAVQMITFLFLVFVCCAEYDNITVLLASAEHSTDNVSDIISEILEENQIVPYSLIMWGLTSIVFAWAVYQHKHFIKYFSIAMYGAILGKVFVHDFGLMDQGEISTLFFALGVFLVAIGMTYPLLKKAGVKMLEARKSQLMETKEQAAVVQVPNR